MSDLKVEGINIHSIKLCYTFILKLTSLGYCYEGQINCSQEMHSNKIKWNCTLLLPCLICTLYLNIQYDGMSLNCATGINEVMHWRRKWQPTPVFLPGESQGPGSLVGCLL